MLPAEGKANVWIGCVVLLMTAVFASGIVLRPQRRHLGLGLDSWIILLIYVLGHLGAWSSFLARRCLRHDTAPTVATGRSPR